MNSVQLIGNIGRLPILRRVGSGKAVLNLLLAVDSVRKTQDKTLIHTNWFDLVVWGPQAEFQAEHLTKGSRVAVQGTLNTRNWIDQDGNKRYNVEIVAHKITWLNLKPKTTTTANKEATI